MMRFLHRDWKRSRVAIVNALLHVGTLVSVTKQFLPRDWKRSRVAIVTALLHVGPLVRVMMRCLHHDSKRSHDAMLWGCTAVALVLPLLRALTCAELVEPLQLG